MVLLTFSAFILMFFDERLDAKDSLILIVLLILSVYYFQPTEDKKSTNSKESPNLSTIIFFLLLSLGMLVYGSNYFINGATQIATTLGVSAYVIGLTLAALGTSLPELAASIQSARKGKFDFIVGNIIGSNLFNIGLVGGVAGILGPIFCETPYPWLDHLSMLLFTVLLIVWMGGKDLKRKHGIMLLILYVLTSATTWVANS